MIDIVVACLVIGIPSILALLVIDRASSILPSYRTREQELSAAGMFPAERKSGRRVVSVGVPELDVPVRPVSVTGVRGDVVPKTPRPRAADIAAPLAPQHP